MYFSAAMDTPTIQAARMTDAELLAAYEASDGDADDPMVRALIAEIEWRNLDL